MAVFSLINLTPVCGLRWISCCCSRVYIVYLLLVRTDVMWCEYLDSDRKMF